MWQRVHKEGWALKNWCFWIVMLEKTPENPLDCKEIKPFNPKGHQSWIFFGRSDAEVEAPILWPPDAKSWLIRKDPDGGKDWRQEEKGTTEGEMDMNLNKLWELVMTGKPGITAVYGVAKIWTWLSNWTKLIHKQLPIEQAISINLWKIISKIKSISFSRLSLGSLTFRYGMLSDRG